MKRGIWVGSFAIALGAMVNSLNAQETWHPVLLTPIPFPLSQADLKSVPVVHAPPVRMSLNGVELGTPVAAFLGRPVPLANSPAQSLFTRTDTSPMLINFAPPGPPDDERPAEKSPSNVAKASEIVADDSASDFAADRVAQNTPTNSGGEFPSRPKSLPMSPAPPMNPEPMTKPPPLVIPDPMPVPLETREPVYDNKDLSVHWYSNAEYLLWTTKKDSVPPLVTTSTDPADAGRLIPGNTTQILFGGGLDSDPHQGARFTTGLWLDDWRSEAIEAQGFFLVQHSAKSAYSSTDHPVLARPFFSLNSMTESSDLVSSPAVGAGRIHIDAPSDLWGIEANARWRLRTTPEYRIDVFAGPRLLHLGEGLQIDEDVVGLPTANDPRFADKHLTSYDRFNADNYFLGAQLGAEARWTYGPWCLAAKGKLALGGVYEQVRVQGYLRSEDLGNNQITIIPRDLLALKTNSGSNSTGNIAFVPEVELHVGYQITDHIRAFAGYDFLYWSSVLRPGNQIDRSLDETLIPQFTTTAAPAGQNRPGIPLKESDFWAQGLTLGLELRY